MYGHTLDCGRKHFCFYCLQGFSTEEILNCNVKDCFNIRHKERIKMPKKSEYVKYKNCERKIKLPFMVYADFESILVLGDNGKQNPEKSYMNKYQKHVASSYGYNLVCVDDKCSKPFKFYLGQEAVYNFVNNSMIKESKYCTDMMKKKMMKILKTLVSVGFVIVLFQEFYSNVLDLLKQKGFYPYEYMKIFEKFKD